VGHRIGRGARPPITKPALDAIAVDAITRDAASSGTRVDVIDVYP
jgi:hypothetical protein